jgi:hypothetical protein
MTFGTTLVNILFYSSLLEHMHDAQYHLDFKKFIFSICLSKSEATDRHFFCSAAVGQTSLTCLMPKALVEIAWHEPQEILSSSVTSLMVNIFCLL